MKKYLSYLSTVALTLVAFGCGNFGNTDVNPNGSPVPLTSTLLTNSLSTLGGAQLGGGESTNYLYSSYYVQYMSQAQYTDASRYGAVDPGWPRYASTLEDLQNIINTNTNAATKEYAASTSGANANQIAIARILKAYWMSCITDRFGDVPYSEALIGKPNPKYDTQQSIYLDLLKELKEAVAQFDDAGAPVKGDIIFGGDNAKWRKFANSWRIILAVRLSKADATTGQSAVKDVIDNLATNGGVFASYTDDMQIAYPGSGAGFQNPWLPVGNDQVICSTLADYLNNTSDDRRNAFGKPASGTLIGMPPGLPRADALAFTSANPNESLVLADDLRKDNSTLVLLSAADVWLARAEAAKLGWTSEDVNTCYQTGITESWNRWGQNDPLSPNPNLATYLASPDVVLGSGPVSDDEKIGIQRWLSFFPNGEQGWAEWRRTGYPSFVQSVPNSYNAKGIPNRYIYPTSEHGLNPVNWAAASAGLDFGDSRDSHVWWDK